MTEMNKINFFLQIVACNVHSNYMPKSVKTLEKLTKNIKKKINIQLIMLSIIYRNDSIQQTIQLSDYNV